MGKAFEKQTKTIEDQGETQIKAIQDNKQQLISGDEYRFNKIEDPITFLNKIKNGKISLKEEKINNKIIIVI